ncbi:hypothetical protein OS242_17635 [Tumebacillus sp. DT12]|uniref:Lipoprotein n=1 Tax=Tumebacillus lacus TaxID=2995335 RepID=A0ABT3X4D7_9BACL|nr:hypothetical protein [Tumebacillus lacus]MCX7571769.1 hypothetical protein [Tumebacillus lacus]
MQKAIPIFVAAAMMLTACSAPADDPAPPSTPPPKTSEPGQQPGSPGGSGGSGTDPNGGTEEKAGEKSEEQIQKEIREKLARMTHPKGYSLPHDGSGRVEDVETLDEVAELLRKKGYAPDIARTLTEEFYEAKNGAIQLIPRDGYPGVFDADKPAAFFKKNKWTWTVEQDHKDDMLHGPHVATYEVEVLRDGSYRLNVWRTKPV